MTKTNRIPKGYLAIGLWAATALVTASCADGGSDDEAVTIDTAIEFVGGVNALMDMTGFEFEVSGIRRLAVEGFNYNDPPMEAGTFTGKVRYDLANDALRIDYARSLTFAGRGTQEYSEIYSGNLGYVAGQDNAFNPADESEAMLSSRWASGRKQQELLNPHILLREVLASADNAATAGEDRIGERTVQLFDITDTVSPIRVAIGEDGELLRARTLINDFLRRDSELEVTYEDWHGDPVKFPAKVTLRVNGVALHEETRTNIVVNPTFDLADFEIPAEANAVFDAELAAWGEVSAQFFQFFLSLGFPLDFRHDVTPAGAFVTEIEADSGIWHITGSLHNSMAIEQDDGIIVLEAPHSPERADAVIAAVKATIPDKPITHVVATHHHEDHSAGLRSFVAEGVTVVVHAASALFYGEIFAADSTLEPDALFMANPAPTPTIVTVAADATLDLDDGDSNPVRILPVINPHASDMLVMYVPLPGNGGVVFNSDLYNPSAADGNNGASVSPALAMSLQTKIDEIIADRYPVTIIAGGHGDFADAAKLGAYIDAVGN